MCFTATAAACRHSTPYPSLESRPEQTAHPELVLTIFTISGDNWRNKTKVNQLRKQIRGVFLGHVGIGNSTSCPCNPDAEWNQLDMCQERWKSLSRRLLVKVKKLIIVSQMLFFFSRWGTLTYFQDKEGIKKPGAPRLLENYLTVQEFTLDICSGFMGQF